MSRAIGRESGQQVRVQGWGLVWRAAVVGFFGVTGATLIALVGWGFISSPVSSIRDLMAGIVIPCAIVSSLLAGFSMRGSRGLPLPARVLSVLLWTAATPAVWTVVFVCGLMTLSGHWSSDNWRVGLGILLGGVCFGTSVWCLTLAPGFVMVLGRFLLRHDVGTAPNPSRVAALNGTDEQAEDAEIFTARRALGELWKKDS